MLLGKHCFVFAADGVGDHDHRQLHLPVSAGQGPRAIANADRRFYRSVHEREGCLLTNNCQNVITINPTKNLSTNYRQKFHISEPQSMSSVTRMACIHNLCGGGFAWSVCRDKLTILAAKAERKSTHFAGRMKAYSIPAGTIGSL